MSAHRPATAAAVGWILLVTAFAANADDLCFVNTPNGKNVTLGCDMLERAHTFHGFGETPPEACNNWGCGGGAIDCGCPAGPGYCWTISLSNTSESQVIGPLTSSVLYLWLDLRSGPAGGGFLAAEFGLGGTLTVDSFVPLNGFANVGTNTDLILLNSGCVASGLYLVGEIHLQTAVSAEPSVNASSWGRIKATYE